MVHWVSLGLSPCFVHVDKEPWCGSLPTLTLLGEAWPPPTLLCPWFDNGGPVSSPVTTWPGSENTQRPQIVQAAGRGKSLRLLPQGRLEWKPTRHQQLWKKNQGWSTRAWLSRGVRGRQDRDIKNKRESEMGWYKGRRNEWASSEVQVSVWALWAKKRLGRHSSVRKAMRRFSRESKEKPASQQRMKAAYWEETRTHLLCGKNCSHCSQSSLSRHHPVPKLEKASKCHKCGKSFSWSSYLVWHQRIWRETSQVQWVWERLQRALQPHRPLENSHREETLPVWGMWEKLQPELKPHCSPEDPHRGEAILVCGLWEKIQQQLPVQHLWWVHAEESPTVAGSVRKTSTTAPTWESTRTPHEGKTSPVLSEWEKLH